MLRKPGDRYPTAGVGFTLSPADDLLVRDGITIQSLDTFGVVGGGRGAKITINGSVLSVDDGIIVDADEVRVNIGITGSIYSADYGLSIFGEGTTVNNAGSINGIFGIVLQDDGSADNKAMQIVNSGSIVATSIGIVSTSQGVIETVLLNTGFIRCFLGSAVILSDGNDRVTNSGLIVGRIELGSGNDLYDGRGGAVIDGAISGQGGNDRFVAGRSREAFDGGNGTDTVDYRTATGVRAALDDSFAGTGHAKGETFAFIENIFGSRTGADSLRGDGTENLIRGYGGNDTLDGFDNNDTINGGAGVDTIIAGFGLDRILFDKPSHGGDVLVDFSAINDDIYINRKGFGLDKLALGELNASRFHEGTTKQAADAGDRFIHRTTDHTLWFDADGTGSKHVPVLIADSNAGDFFASDIFLF